MVIPRRFASWTGWSGFFRSRVTRPRLPTVRLTGGLRTTVHRVFWSASVRCRYQAISMRCVVLCYAVWCGVLCCVVWCGVVWCGVVWCGVVWCGVVWCGVVWCGVVWCGVVWCGVVWCGVVWCGVVWCGVVWCGVGLAYAGQTFCDSNSTCRMNSVPMLCGPASPICAVRMDGVAMAADHCSSTAGSHNWPDTWDAQSSLLSQVLTGRPPVMGLHCALPEVSGCLHRVDAGCTAARCGVRSAPPVPSWWRGCASDGPPGVSAGHS